MRILVTGGAGFIGSHCAKYLHNHGHESVVLDNLSMGHRWAVKWGELAEGDLLDRDFLHELFAKHQFDAVIHFAACAYVGESMHDPGKYFTNNTTGTINLLEAMHQAGVKKLVFSSTCATYGEPDQIPITEQTPQNPVNPYGESKLMVEHILRWYGEIHDLRWCALRYFNVAGCDPDAEIGEDHDPETHLIPLCIYAAQGKRDKLTIFGTDYPTPDGTAIRDYIHVWDLVAAHVLAIKALDAGKSGLRANLGTGTGHSVREVIDTVSRVCGITVPAVEGARRAGDPPALVAAADKARKELGWEPQYPSLEDMVKHAWQWYKKR